MTWFFETFVLERFESHFKPCHAAFRELYNSYYNGIGKQFSRPDRGLITRPALFEVVDYRHQVDDRILAVIDQYADQPELLKLIELGLHHEQQHQELLLMDIKHLLSINPLAPAYSDAPQARSIACESQWRAVDGGLYDVGNDGTQFHFDNEGPRSEEHTSELQSRSDLV
mgnify:CR=1 FL=1